jgi:thiol-disulfide isomerase/thioredoxin
LRERPDYRELLADLDRRFPVQPLAPARAYAALLQEAGGVQARYQYLRRRAATPSARKMALAKKPRFEDHAAKFLQFADIHRNSPFAVEALFWILDNSNPQDGQTVQAAVAGLREKTLQVLERDHFQKADLADVCQRFAEKPMPDVAQLLRKALEKHALQDVRGLAGYALALSLAKQAELAGPRSPTEAAKLTLKAERQLEQVAKEYGSIPSGKSTLGEAAQAKLYELRHLTIGRQAPEIEGHDFAGKKFKLSDYRGKVVVLDFWANWCGYCRQMYPQERKLIERLRNKPFALIGVNCDDDKAEVQREIEKEKLSWRSWWDGGSTGQRITKQWQVESFPTLYILDSKGVIRYKNLRGPKLDAAVEKLLKEAPPSG